MLDVELEVARERGRVAAGVSQSLLAQSRALEPGEQRLAAAAGCRERFGRQRPCQRLAAEQPHEGAILVREVDGLERAGQFGVAQRDKNVQRRHDSERAVVAAAVGDGVEVGA